MKAIYSLATAILFMINVSAQISDDFSDGNFSSAPAWSGSSTHFIINSAKQLQVNNNVADTSYLSIPLPLVSGTAEWRFFLKMAFSPSSSNYSKIWLLADTSDLLQAQGYYLQFGETGANDAIGLFKKTGNVHTSICKGSPSQIAASFALFVKVQYSSTGEWKIFTSADGLSYDLQAGANDLSNLGSNYSGFAFYYTSSNASRFYVDDYYYGEATEDSIAPRISEAKAAGRKHIEIRFTETPEKNSAENILSYSITPAITIDTIYRDLTEAGIVHVLTGDSLSNQSYMISANNICDPYQNCSSGSINFSAFFPGKFDVVINELMIDPTPSQGIPECEYIELLNRTGNRIDVSNWRIRINGSEKVITNADIPPYGFLLLTSSSCASEFALLADAAAVTGFTTTTLTNSSAELELTDKESNRIHYINYDLSWYNDLARQGGGWSIEQINPDAVCSDRSNWKASKNSEGGTPGFPNSVMFRGPAAQPAHLESLCTEDGKTIGLQFTSATQIEEILDPLVYEIDNGIGRPDSISSSGSAIKLRFNNPFQDNISYSLKIEQPLRNCRSESFHEPPFQFSVNKGDQSEILITEIMPDPGPSAGLPDYEYIEIYNASQYPVNVGSWQVCSNNYCVTLPCRIIPAGSYMLLSEKNHPSFQNLVETDLPSLSNEGGHLKLLNKEGKVISSLQYSIDWHTSLKKDGGWSLEMKDLSNPCGERENWTSSMNERGGTPGFQNSVYSAYPDLTAPLVRYAVIKDSVHIRLHFDEMISMEDLPSISIDQGIGIPIAIIPSTDLKSILLETRGALTSGKRYSITISNISDCVGNHTSSVIAYTGYPEMIEPNDIVINEILADTRHPDEEFIELYNRSGKILSLNGLTGGAPDTLYGNVTGLDLLDTTGYLLFPGEYVALCRDQKILCRYYQCSVGSRILPDQSFPSLSSEGIFSLSTINGKLIDHVEYDNDLHFQLLKETKGVSLEKIDPERPGTDRTNWHSASQLSGGATPGRQNSQYGEAEGGTDISISPEVFTPDNDGINDVVNISFDLDGPGKVSNVFIFSETGSLKRKLIENQIAGIRGTYSWDGISDNGELCRTGIYIVYFETFDPGGTVKNYKQTCVLSGRR